jgi:type VI protein secretion system component Hcp
MEDMMAQKPEEPKLSTPDELVTTKGVELNETELDTVTGGKASPVLMQACATGTHLKEATITG